MNYKYYFMVANQIYDYKLTPSAFAVYCYLLRCADRAGTCFPSRSTIAENCVMGVKTVDKALNILIDKGLIEKRQGLRNNNSYSSNIYFVENLLR